MRLSKFLVFCGDNYYPSGGWEEFKGSFGTLEDAINFLLDLNYNWYHIVNLESESIVKSGKKKYE